MTLQDSCSSIWLMFEVLAMPGRYLALYQIISHNLICFCFEVRYHSVRNGLSISLSERSDKCLDLCVVCGSEGFRHWCTSCAGQELWDVELRRKPMSFSLGPEHEVKVFLWHPLVDVEGFSNSYPRCPGECLRPDCGSHAKRQASVLYSLCRDSGLVCTPLALRSSSLQLRFSGNGYAYAEVTWAFSLEDAHNFLDCPR